MLLLSYKATGLRKEMSIADKGVRCGHKEVRSWASGFLLSP